MIKFNSVSLGGCSLFMLTIGLLQLGVIRNGYSLIICFVLSALVIFVPIIKDLCKAR